MRRTIIALAVAAVLSGCASVEIRIACTVAQDEALAVLAAGPLRIAAGVAEADRREVCR